jgi:transcriptional regulator with XRE-family HTH domain
MLVVGEAERRRRFGYALQEALKARGLSERQLAARLEIDARKVARWRSGKDLPNLYETQALVEALRIDEELFRNPPEVPEAPAYPIDRYLVDDERSVVEEVAEQAADRAVDEARDERRSAATPGRRNGDPAPGEPA